MIDEDAPQIARLFEAVVATLPYYNERAQKEELSKYAPDELRAMVQSDPNAVLVAEGGKNICGFCISRYDDGIVWLAWFVVREDQRGCGIGRALLSALEASCSKRKCHKIWCDTRVPNERSARVLKSAGFRNVCTFLNHWYGQDFHIWEKVISA